MNCKPCEIHIDGVKLTRGPGGLDFIEISNDYASASICTQGAHLTSFTPHGAKPVVWMSEQSAYTPGKPLRGGVPVCWPWFGPAPAPGKLSHGFARATNWKLVGCDELAGGATGLRFALDESICPEAGFAFKLEMAFTIGKALEMTLTTQNLSQAPVTIGEALHTYFNISDITNVEINGLDGAVYEDRVPGAPKLLGNRQQGPIRFTAETDRIYLPTQSTAEIVDRGFGRTVVVEKSGSLSTVVWNPWQEKSRRMADFGDEEYHTMLCIEAANAAGDTRTLPSGQSHSLTQKISIR